MPTKKKVKLYKVLTSDGYPKNGGHGKYNLPKNGKPGNWMPKATPIMCNSGYHVVDAAHVADWLSDDCAVFEAKIRGNVTGSLSGDSKIAAEEIQLLREVDLKKVLARLDNGKKKNKPTLASIQKKVGKMVNLKLVVTNSSEGRGRARDLAGAILDEISGVFQLSHAEQGLIYKSTDAVAQVWGDVREVRFTDALLKA